MSKSNDSFLSITDLFRLCLARWQWFVASVLICFLFAVRQILTAPYLYSRSASIMVHEDAIGNNITDKNSKEFSEIGFIKQRNNLSDILRHITSLEVLMEVARKDQKGLTETQALTVAFPLSSSNIFSRPSWQP